jgi:hypothetical protein
MKKKFLLICLFISSSLLAAIPTEEGLLKNLNNPNVPGSYITVKATIKKVPEVGKLDSGRVDYYKFILALNGLDISLLQMNYSGSQMLNSQIQDVKLIPDLNSAIKKEKDPEKSMFYGVLVMLATNRSSGMNAFLEKIGVNVLPNKNLLNEDKIKLLKSYRTYLLTTKGKGEASSPLNPTDPTEKTKVIELFKSNTYKRSQNITLIKEGNEFLWEADWKSAKALFTNEERRFKYLIYNQGEFNFRLDASDYVSFNNNNEFPKSIIVKDENGEQYKVSTLSEEIKKSQDKTLEDRYEEAKKLMTKPIEGSMIFGFLF